MIHPGPITYPTPLGTIHVDQDLDEITLMRMINAARNVNTEWRWVSRVVVGPTMVGLMVFDNDGEGPLLTEDGNDIRSRWFWSVTP